MNYKRGQFHTVFLAEKAKHESLLLTAYDEQNTEAFKAEKLRWKEQWESLMPFFTDSCDHVAGNLYCEIVEWGENISLVCVAENKHEISVEYVLTSSIREMEFGMVDIVKNFEDNVARIKRGTDTFKVLGFLGTAKNIGDVDNFQEKARTLYESTGSNKRPYILCMGDKWYLGISM